MLAVFLRRAAPLRFAVRRKGILGTAYLVGFARASGARSTHGYALAAATRLRSIGEALRLLCISLNLPLESFISIPVS